MIRKIQLLPLAGVPKTSLLELEDSAAEELRERATQIAEKRANANFIRSLIRRLERRSQHPSINRGRWAEELQMLVRSVRREISEPSSPSSEAVSSKLLADLESCGGTHKAIEVAQEFLDTAEHDLSQLETKSFSARVATFGGESDTIPKYALGIIGKLQDIKLLHLRERRNEIGPAEAQRLLSLKMARGGGEKLTALQNVVNGLIGVKIDAFSTEGSNNYLDEPMAEIDVDDFLVEVNGAGIREALRVVLDTHFEEPDILLVEEPEIHLHPSLESNLMRYLSEESKRRQVFITTHSTNFIDRTDAQSIFLAKKIGKACSISRIEIEKEYNNIMENLGVRLSSLFMYDRIVFVEGPSDELVLREWAAKIGANISQRNVGFIPIRGIGNFTHYAAQEVVSFLTRRQVKVWMLLDRDERLDSDLAVMKERLGDAVVFFDTQARELENHLLVDYANLEYLAERKGADFDPPAKERFWQELDECAGALRASTVEKRVASVLCTPLYSDRSALKKKEFAGDAILKSLEIMRKQVEERLGRLEEMRRQEADFINSVWDRDKLKIVSGAELLDEWYKRYGLRFDKMRDGAKIAARMRPGDIPEFAIKMLKELAD